jgi:hypothetical protein
MKSNYDVVLVGFAPRRPAGKCQHLGNRASFLKMEEVYFSKTLASPTSLHVANTEEHHHPYSHESLKSHIVGPN